jgi:uncharacterized DUF497 family protein
MLPPPVDTIVAICSVEFSWDEPKREWVLAERGIDFLRVAFALFDGPPRLYRADAFESALRRSLASGQ